MAFDAKDKVLTSTIVQVPSGIPCTRELICVKTKPYYHICDQILQNRTKSHIKLTPPVDSYTIVQVLTLSTTQTT